MLCTCPSKRLNRAQIRETEVRIVHLFKIAGLHVRQGYMQATPARGQITQPRLGCEDGSNVTCRVKFRVQRLV